MDVEGYARNTEGGAAVSDQWGNIVREVLQGKASSISTALRRSVVSKGLVKSGALSKDFRPSIAERYGDPYALRFSIPRYGYILNAGRAAMEVQDKKQNRRYQWNAAIPKHDFIENAISEHVEDLADRLQKAGADAVVNVFENLKK